MKKENKNNNYTNFFWLGSALIIMGFFSSIFINYQWEVYIIWAGLISIFYGIAKKQGKINPKVPFSLKLWKFLHILNVVGTLFLITLLIVIPSYLLKNISPQLTKISFNVDAITSFIYSIFILYGIKKENKIGLYFSYIYIIQSIIVILFNFYSDFNKGQLIFLLIVIIMGILIFKNRKYFKEKMNTGLIIGKVKRK